MTLAADYPARFITMPDRMRNQEHNEKDTDVTRKPTDHDNPDTPPNVQRGENMKGQHPKIRTEDEEQKSER